MIRGYDRLALFSAIALVIVSYLIYGCYDLLGRAYCGHKLAKRQVMLVSFICYAFNLTLSTWVGGIGMRYRLYSRLGLNGSTITRIFLKHYHQLVGLYSAGRGDILADLVKLPPHWYISQTTLRIIGGVMLILTLCYLFGCAFAKRRHLTIKGQRLVLPSWRFALLQMGLSAANWMAMGAIIWLLLGSEINYFLVLGVLLVSSIAGVIIHIPAGIGVLEAVFIAMLSGKIFRRARSLPPCSRGARSIISCHCCWRRWPICCWRAGRKSCGKEPAQAGPRMKRSGRAALARAYGV